MARYNIDIETACTVEGCAYHGQAKCEEKHSLSPWHSRITVIGVTSEEECIVFRGSAKVLELKGYIECDPDYSVEGQQFKFDWLHLAVHGWEIPLDRWQDDAGLMAYVLTEKVPDSYIEEMKRKAPPGKKHRFGKHSLKVTAPYFLGVEPFWEVDDKDNDEYVLKDAEYSRRLRLCLEAKLKALGQYDFYKTKQLEWTKLLAKAELRGVRLDMVGLETVEQEFNKKAVKLKQELDAVWAEAHKTYARQLKDGLRDKYADQYDRAVTRLKDESKAGAAWDRCMERMHKASLNLPQGVDYDSPAQMSWLLRDYYGYDITSLEGDQSTAREVLERLAEEGKSDVKTYLEWRKANKILTAFLPSYRQLSAKDGPANERALHPIYNPDVTKTGRTSSERPNAQQVPPALRKLIVARPGYKLIGYDAAAIEAKLIALYTEDPTLCEIIQSNISLHDFNTVNFFEMDGVEYSQIKTEYTQHRKAAKNVGFALFYNAGANRIRIAGAMAGFIFSMEQSKRIHQRHKDAFPVASAYSKGVVEAFENGDVMENLLGRPLSIEDPEDAYMQGFNKLIQSSASDYLLHSSLTAERRFSALGIDAIPILFVHDFVGFEVEESRAAEADRILVNSLTDYGLATKHGPIKLEVEGGIMDRWEK